MGVVAMESNGAVASMPLERQDLVAMPHALPIDPVLGGLGVDAERGLDEPRAAEPPDPYGPEPARRAAAAPRMAAVPRAVPEPVIGILIAAAVIAGLMGEWSDTLAILAIVLLNGVLGFIQEERAERALAALQRLSAPLAKVLRDGRLRSVPARDLVPGDRIALEAGDSVPADARLIRAFDLRVQEAALTGESVPVAKDADGVLDRRRRRWATGATWSTWARPSPPARPTRWSSPPAWTPSWAGSPACSSSTEREPTPLQRRLAELGKVLIAVVLGIVALIFLLRLLRGGRVLESFLLSVSLAVAAVPEGLPAVVTLALAIGLQRLVRRNALIRKLPSVETLGSVTVICSDKTGTLTRNEMTVREVVTGSAHYHVSGAGLRAPRRLPPAATSGDEAGPSARRSTRRTGRT